MTPSPTASKLTLVLGGTRSGKSELAERLVLAHPGPLLYLATGTAVDHDMAARIGAHQARRGLRFTTVEAGADLAPALRAAPDQAALVDALGTWVAAHHDFELDVDALVAALRDRRAPTVVVSDEVGMGVHPETALGRAFRDALGTVNRAVAEVADAVHLVVAGRVLPLARPEDIGWPGPA